MIWQSKRKREIQIPFVSSDFPLTKIEKLGISIAICPYSGINWIGKAFLENRNK